MLCPGHLLGCVAVDHAPSSHSQEALLESLSASLSTPRIDTVIGKEHDSINHAKVDVVSESGRIGLPQSVSINVDTRLNG